MVTYGRRNVGVGENLSDDSRREGAALSPRTRGLRLAGRRVSERERGRLDREAGAGRTDARRPLCVGDVSGTRQGCVTSVHTEGGRARLGPLFITLVPVHLLINVAPKTDTAPLLLGHPSRPHEQHGGATARFARNCPQNHTGQSFLC